MIPRIISPKLNDLITQYPIVTILGPRQSGKSTLVRNTFPDREYFNLEMPDERALIAQDPRGFLDSLSGKAVILDEIQRLPELLSYLQAFVDEKDQSGQFILTGSHQLALHEAISQSLAGRTAILKLLPLTFSELEASKLEYDLEDFMLNGFFPRIYKSTVDQHSYYQNYTSTYLEKDVRKMISVKDLGLFQDFLQLAAGRVGQLVNYNSMSNELGISHHTVKQWFSVLEASFICVRLKPYFENISKRVVKTPKIYFTDTGLLCYLLGIESKKQLARDPLRGNIFENMILMELVKYKYNQGKDHNLFFYRDNHQNEVDVLYKQASSLIPIEIKSSKTYNDKFLKGLNFIKALLPDRIKAGAVIYSGDTRHNIHSFSLLNFKQAVDAIRLPDREA